MAGDAGGLDSEWTDAVVYQEPGRSRRVLTVCVTLAVIGAIAVGAQLYRGGDGTIGLPARESVIVFLETSIQDEQLSDLETEIAAHPNATSFTFWDQAKSVEEFETMAAGDQAALDWLDENRDRLSLSYRIAPTDKKQETIDSLIMAFKDQLGVRDVTFAPYRGQLPEGSQFRDEGSKPPRQNKSWCF